MNRRTTSGGIEGELLEAHHLALDPINDGFCGVIVELYRYGEPYGGSCYELVESATLTGNTLLKVRSRSLRSIRALLERELAVVAERAGDTS